MLAWTVIIRLKSVGFFELSEDSNTKRSREKSFLISKKSVLVPNAKLKKCSALAALKHVQSMSFPL